MSTRPFKRRRALPHPERRQLALLRGLVEGDVEVELHKSDTALVLQAGSLSVHVPEKLATRSQTINHAPEGVVKDTARVFAGWLAHEWHVDLDGKNDLAEPQHTLSEDDMNRTFDALQACHFLQDKDGLATYSSAVHSMLLESPCMCDLPFTDRIHATTAHRSQPFALLEDLPSDLVRIVLHIDPLAVLDRLPLGSNSGLARLACDTHNAWMLSLDPEDEELWRELWAASQCWEWRSALAQHAGTRLCIAINHDVWEEDVCGRLPGLHAFAMEAGKHKPHPFELCLPEDLVALRLTGRADRSRGWQGLHLPTSLRHLSVCMSPWADTIYERLALADVKLPSQLRSLALEVHWINVSNARLPEALTSLSIYIEAVLSDKAKDGNLVDLRALVLPPNLSVLRFCRCSISPGSLQSVTLPPTLKTLAIDGVDVPACDTAALALPPALTSLTIKVASLTSASLAGLQLPSSLLSLDIGGGEAGCTNVSFPVGLTRLCMASFLLPGHAPEVLEYPALPKSLKELSLNGAVFEASDWLAPARLLGSLTALTILAPRLSAENLARAAWPSALQTLRISPEASDGPIKLHALPATLRALTLNSQPSKPTRVSFDGVKLPVALTSLDLSGSLFSDDDRALAPLAWPAGEGLRYLCLDHTDFGSPGHLRHVQLPDSIEELSLRRTHLGRRECELWQLPRGLVDLDLTEARFGDGGLPCLALPDGLTRLCCYCATLDGSGMRGVRLPDSLVELDLRVTEHCPAGLMSESLWPLALEELYLHLTDGQAIEELCRFLPGSLSLLHIVGCNADPDVHGFVDNFKDRVEIVLEADDTDLVIRSCL